MNNDGQVHVNVGPNYAQQAAMNKQKSSMIGGNNFGGTSSSFNQKLLNSSGGYNGIITHGHGMLQGNNHQISG